MSKFKASRKLLDILIDLGLDPTTGTSNWLGVQAISDGFGKNITGNGSLIRRDAHPFDKLNFDILKEGQSNVAYKFLGYKTAKDMIDDIEDHNEKSRKRIQDTLIKIEERESDKETILRRYPNINKEVYDFSDLIA